MRALSLFSGIEAASVAWDGLIDVVAFAEIEPFPCALLAARFPSVPNLGDVTVIADEQIAALGPLDIVIGGSPCQDLSVAGRRVGLAGKRSSLFHEQVRIFHAARSHCGARFLLWENVPGAFSTHKGRDFAEVVGTLAGCKLAVPGDGWGTEGVALGEFGLVEWAVLDAQWFGVAQRRRRVFALLDAGDWTSRSPILLERESLRGDTAPRRETEEGAAGTLAARTRGGGGLGIDFDCSGGLVAHSLSAEGFDASEDGTGRGTPLIPDVAWALQERDAKGADSSTKDGHLIPVALFDERNVTSPTNRAACRVDGAVPTMHQGPMTLAFTCKDSGADAGEIAPTLRAMHEQDGNANAGGQVAIAFDARQSDVINYGDMSGPLDTDGHTIGIQQAMQVRRLTPRECERLQGFPDDWTAIKHRGKPAADGPRYRAIGNSMAVPVIRWIGQRIVRAAA